MASNVVCKWEKVDQPDIDGYNLYLADDGTTFVKQNSNVIPNLYYTLESLADGSYDWYVTAVRLGAESSPSAQDSFTLPPP